MSAFSFGWSLRLLILKATKQTIKPSYLLRYVFFDFLLSISIYIFRQQVFVVKVATNDFFSFNWIMIQWLFHFYFRITLHTILQVKKKFQTAFPLRFSSEPIDGAVMYNNSIQNQWAECLAAALNRRINKKTMIFFAMHEKTSSNSLENIKIFQFLKLFLISVSSSHSPPPPRLNWHVCVPSFQVFEQIC